MKKLTLLLTILMAAGLSWPAGAVVVEKVGDENVTVDEDNNREWLDFDAYSGQTLSFWRATCTPTCAGATGALSILNGWTLAAEADVKAFLTSGGLGGLLDPYTTTASSSASPSNADVRTFLALIGGTATLDRLDAVGYLSDVNSGDSTLNNIVTVFSNGTGASVSRGVTLTSDNSSGIKGWLFRDVDVAVPEPGTLPLIVGGFAFLAYLGGRRGRTANRR